MREIKFRAWEKNLKEIIPINSINFETKMINTNSAWRLFNEINLMQYTGLKDKNRNEIYEGDIVKIGGETTISLVTYRNACFYTPTEKGNYRLGGWMNIEIIGNIYENPNLVENV